MHANPWPHKDFLLADLVHPSSPALLAGRAQYDGFLLVEAQVVHGRLLVGNVANDGLVGEPSAR